jgi:tartrate dehydratase beta subunit/fumarate hydratase class I family protein
LVEKTGVSLIDLKFLKEHGLMAKTDLIKVLGRGELKSKVTVSVNAFSKSAVSAIEKLGGSAHVVTRSIATVEVSELPQVAASALKADKSTTKGEDVSTNDGVQPE